MNFFDTYDVARVPTPQPSDENQPTLNEEVNQVIGQLGRFWGGFKKQSQQVLEVAKKDLGDVVLQAQKEIGKLTAVEGPQPEASTSAVGGQETIRSAGSAPAASADSSVEDGNVASSSVTLEQPHAGSASGHRRSLSLFSRLQSSLPPNLVSTVQNHIPESIKHASENIDITQIGNNLITEFQRVQGITRVQAEEYARKSEALIREAVKEANEVLKDAVKIIPPEPAIGDSSTSGAIWDGSDMWMLPNVDQGTSSTGKERAGGQPAESRNAVASRALVLLHRLQSDPTIVQHDPEADEGVRESYKTWREEEIKAKGGIESPEWTKKTDKLLKDEASLYEMHASLVPSTLSKEEFWSRYFFRAHQIKHEEERRKALIQATVVESDEEFSWEDEEDEHSTPATAAATRSSVPPPSTRSLEQNSVVEASPAALAAGSPSSPSAGSADSFDVVSSANASVAGDSKKPTAPETEPDKDDEDDEDEDEDDDEDEDEDEDDDDDDDEDDSDWE